MGCSILALYFHLYCAHCFVRQAALTFILAGCAISLARGQQEKIKNVSKQERKSMFITIEPRQASSVRRFDRRGVCGLNIVKPRKH